MLAEAIETIDGMKFYKNPSRKTIDSIISKNYDCRGVKVGNDIFIWHEDLIHEAAMEMLGIERAAKFYVVPDNDPYFLASSSHYYRSIGDGLMIAAYRKDFNQIAGYLSESKRSDKEKRFLKKAKPDFQKRYGDAWKSVLYATARKIFHEGLIPYDQHINDEMERRIERNIIQYALSKIDPESPARQRFENKSSIKRWFQSRKPLGYSEDVILKRAQKSGMAITFDPPKTDIAVYGYGRTPLKVMIDWDTDGGSTQGLYDPHSNTIILYPPVEIMGTKFTPAWFDFVISQVSATLRHELRHANQFNFLHPYQRKSRGDYLAQQVEFDPQIGSIAEAFVRLYEIDRERPPIGQAIRALTGMSSSVGKYEAEPFFMRQKEISTRRFKAAVKKLTAEIEKLLASKKAKA